MKKVLITAMTISLIAGLTGCSGNGGTNNGFKGNNEITVISREANSGTRGAFDELMKIVQTADGKTTDKLFNEAVIVDSTDAVASKVEVDKYAIGYTSLGAVTDSVKALPIEGVNATTANVKSGAYKISRPFILVTKGEADELSADFIAFINSEQGQKIIVDRGYIAAHDSTDVYVSSNKSGKITLSGSTSVEKPMEKLKEEYIKLNPNIAVEIIYSGSSAGIKDATDGKVQIGMSSRELKDSEKETLKDVTFALDGIAVIVNKNNPITGVTMSVTTKIFTGEIRTWSDVK